MYCALKSDCMEYVVWDGQWDVGPQWFIDYCSEEMLMDEYNNCLFEIGDCLEIADPYIIFVRNSRGEVKVFDIDITPFVLINSYYCCIPSDIMYYYIYDGCEHGPFPEWFERSEDYRLLIAHEGQWMYYDNIDDTCVVKGSPYFVFVHSEGRTKYFEPYWFDRIFEHNEGGRIKCMLS